MMKNRYDDESLRPIVDRGVHLFSAVHYGRSVRGLPLEVFKPQGRSRLLIVAGIHGEESDTTVLLSKALRSLNKAPESTAAILAANPDGLLAGTRGNARGVDLNRNFAASNWRSDRIKHQWKGGGPQEVELSPGASPESEPETRALRELVEDLEPDLIITLHGALGWIDDPTPTPQGQWIAEQTGLPLVADPGYATPGSFGTWSHERGIPLITYEFPMSSVWHMLDTHLPVLIEFLEKGIEAGKR